MRTLDAETIPMIAPAPAAPGRRPGRPSARDCPTLRLRNLRWLFATLAGARPRPIAADPVLSGGHALRTIQAGIRAARALGPRRGA